MSLTATVTSEPPDGIVLVTVDGRLTAETAPLLRLTLMKCLMQAPDVVIVEIGGMRIDKRSRLALFAAALHTHAQPGTALMVCGASDELAIQMGGGILGEVPSFATYADAHAAVADDRLRAPRRMSIRLAATPSAPGNARAMITHACRSWNIDHLNGPALQVISELVTNAVQHARTDLYVTAAFRGNHLYLSVRDHSPQTFIPPNSDTGSSSSLAEGGRGLRLVDVYSTAWGWHTGDGTKTVWATLRATPKWPMRTREETRQQ